MSKIREARDRARAEAAARDDLHPEAVLVGAPVAYIPRSVLRSLLAGKIVSAKVYSAQTPSDYALIAVPPEQVDGMKQRELLGGLLADGVITLGDGLNTAA